MKSNLLIIACLFYSTIATAQTKNFIDQPYLETTAQADTLVVPDIIYLQIVIRESDEKGRVSLEELENRMASKLRALGIDVGEQLSIDNLGSNFHKYFLRKKDILKSKAYRLKVYDGLTAGKVIQGLESVGISNVQLGKTEYSKMKSLRLQLKSKAVARAKEQAEYLAAPLGQKIGGALHISDRYYQGIAYRVKSYQAAEMSMVKQDSYEPIDIEFGPLQVQTEVAVKFKLE